MVYIVKPAKDNGRDTNPDINVLSHVKRGPSYSIGGTGRMAEHPHNTSPGPVYNPKLLIGGKSYSFPKAPQLEYKYPYPDTSCDQLALEVKYKSCSRYATGFSPGFGMGQRGEKENNESPGPVYDPKIDACRPNVYRAYSLGLKTKILASESQTPPNVCSNTYPLHDPAFESRYPWQAVFTFSKAARGDMDKPKPYSTEVYEIPGGLGKQVLSTMKSAGEVPFSISTRDARDKLAYSDDHSKHSVVPKKPRLYHAIPLNVNLARKWSSDADF